MADQKRPDKIATLETQIREVTVVMRDNIDKAIARGEDIENLQLKAENLEQNAGLFENSARTLKRKQRWRYIRNSLIILFIVLFIILVLVLVLHPWTY